MAVALVVSPPKWPVLWKAVNDKRDDHSNNLHQNCTEFRRMETKFAKEVGRYQERGETLSKRSSTKCHNIFLCFLRIFHLSNAIVLALQMRIYWGLLRYLVYSGIRECISIHLVDVKRFRWIEKTDYAEEKKEETEKMRWRGEKWGGKTKKEVWKKSEEKQKK